MSAEQKRTFSFEEDFQKTILAAALKDPSFMLQYSDVLIPSYFDYEYLSSIMRTARELSERLGEVPTKMSVVEEVKDFCVKFHVKDTDRNFLLNSLEDIYSIEVVDIEFIREKVVSFGQTQALRSAVLKIVELFQSKKDSTFINEKARNELEAALRVGLDTRDLGISLYPNLTKLPQLAQQSKISVLKKIPTGFKTIDDYTLGGPGRGELWVVIGLAGRGKSAFLVNIGAAALREGKSVIHISIGDLDQLDVAIRYACRLTKSTTKDVITNSESYQKKASVVSRYDPHLHIKYYAPDSVSMQHIRAYISKVKLIHEFSPALVIIDYPEELQMPVKNDMYQSGGANYSAMKAMANEFDCLFWAASQPQRWFPAHKDDVIRGQNIGESSKKFHKVDGLVSWNVNDEEELMGRGRLWVDKTRRAKSFYLVHCKTDMERMTMEETDPPASAVDEDNSYLRRVGAS